MHKPVIAVALSGGVDSLVSGFLLKEKYPHVFGLHFITGYENRPGNMAHIKEQLKMDIVCLDLSAAFEQKVVQYFVSTYTQGQTPNPCMVCNQKIKFGILLEQAKKLGADYLATGHYAAIVNTLTRPHLDTSHAWLEKGMDTAKDQSYFLARLSSRQLSQVLCPLADFTKEQVKDLAVRYNLAPLRAKESQDICFIHDTGICEFITDKTGMAPRKGPVMDMTGRHVGTHDGVFKFTIGQRRGINCPASEPYYVRKIDPLTNSLHVCFKKDLAQDQMAVDSIMWNDPDTDDTQNLKTKIRYHHKEADSRLYRKGSAGRVIFNHPQHAVTPGQAAVFYKGKKVSGSGIIQ
ncbi:MAG: tRNA 2-thiouridine(34) synthase MnmA [Desulfotignum sp.]|jgi:tRNA-specific 2-thiouridylase|nr:tRNA 2-thiouridine(34) synthase MnmA [Desulfotignum sp.]